MEYPRQLAWLLADTTEILFDAVLRANSDNRYYSQNGGSGTSRLCPLARRALFAAQASGAWKRVISRSSGSACTTWAVWFIQCR